MESRSSYLYKIESALSGRGLDRRIDSIPALRALFPGLRGRLDLDTIAIQAETIDLALWLNAPTKQKERPSARLGTLSYKEIRDRRSQGETYRSIALSCGLSSERVRQICKIPSAIEKPKIM